eukprot:2875817-Amphidinium_carterae.1
MPLAEHVGKASGTPQKIQHRSHATKTLQSEFFHKYECAFDLSKRYVVSSQTTSAFRDHPAVSDGSRACAS